MRPTVLEPRLFRVRDRESIVTSVSTEYGSRGDTANMLLRSTTVARAAVLTPSIHSIAAVCHCAFARGAAIALPLLDGTRAF